ncbi:MAG: stalk domain-containing protein [Bacillota bacterium]
MRTFRVLFLGFLVLLSLSTLVFAASPVRVIVNGVDLGPAAQGQVIDGQVMVPLRAVAEALGADVKWDPVASCVYVTTAGATEVSEEPAPAPAEKKEVTVYITKTGSKYHRLGCRYLSKSCIPISLEDAKARGYSPCSVCGAPQ